MFTKHAGYRSAYLDILGYDPQVSVNVLSQTRPSLDVGARCACARQRATISVLSWKIRELSRTTEMTERVLQN
jgi:hypothetical protein